MIKKNFHVLILVLICLLTSVTTRSVLSQESDSKFELLVGIINLENVQLQSLAFTSLREQTQSIQKKIEKKIEKRRESIRIEQSELEEEQLLLSNEALTEKKEQLQKKIVDLRGYADNANKSLEQTYNQAILLIQSKLKEAIASVAEERNLSLILNENNIPPTVIFSHNSLRIDEPVLERLNLLISDIEISESIPEGQATSTPEERSNNTQ